MRELHRVLLCVALAAGSGYSAARAGETPVRVADEIARTETELKRLDSERDTLKTKLTLARRTLLDNQAKQGCPAGDTQFHLPRLKTAPVIDGVIGETEWDGAAGIPLTCGIYGMQERKSSDFLVGWDPEYLYFAQRLPLREGEKLKRLNREPKHDNVYCGETSLEAYVDRRSHGSHGSLCRWQFMGNAVGNRWDREAQYEIGQDFYGWDGDWQYAQRLTPDGKYWEAEIAIPRKTVYQAEPIKEGDLWWIGFASNLHNPWMSSGFYGWKIPAVFKDSVPQIRMRDPQRSLTVRGIAFDMDILNTTATPLRAELVVRLSDRADAKIVAFEKTYAVAVEPGKTQVFNIKELPGDKIKDGAAYKLSIMVLEGETSIYTWSYPIAYNKPENKEGVLFVADKDPFVAQAAYNPLSNYVRAEVDKYDFPQRDKVRKVSVKVVPAGKDTPLGRADIARFEHEKGDTRVALPADLPVGPYACVFELLDDAGKTLATVTTTFERKDLKKDFPWLYGNRIGEDDVVLKPFSPLAVKRNVIQAHDKTITVDGLGLPGKIMAAGVDLLAGGMGFHGVSGGKDFTVVPDGAAAPVSASATHAVYRGGGRGGPVKIASEVRWEYDSTANVRITLEPAQAGAKVSLDSLRLVIPFTREGGTNFIANGLNMRLSNVAGNIPGPGKTGRVWDSRSVPYQKMTVGSFVPFMWVGNLRSGLTWFADNDRGWWPSDRHPAIEIERTKEGGVNLVLNIAAEPVEFSEAREIRFGLNVNPVRKTGDEKRGSGVFGFLKELGRWDPEIGKERQEFARRYPDNIGKNRDYVKALHHYGELYTPYTEMSGMDFYKHEVDYFREEWDNFGYGGPIFGKSSNDSLLYWTERWIQDAGLDGYYFDNVFNRLNWNTHFGTGYKLPDGRIQPGYNLWGMRDQIKRIRTVLQKHRDPMRIVIHNTRFQFAPIMAFADLAMGGEMPTPSGRNPGAGDFMDMHARDFMDVQYNVPLWGYRLSHLYHFDTKSYVDESGTYAPEVADKVHRSAMATMLVHGVEFFQGIDGKGGLMTKYRMLKKLAGDTFEFIPSWKAEGLFRLEGGSAKDLDVAVYRGKDLLLIIAANYSKSVQDARVWVDFPKMIGMPAPLDSRYVLDFETLEFPGYITEKNTEDKWPRVGDLQGGHNIMHMANTLKIKVQPHDFRAILIMNLPPARGAGF